MRSLHVITDTARRGAQVFGVDLVAQLRSAGHEADVIALERARSSEALDVRHLGGGRLVPATISTLRSLMAAYDVTVAHGSSTLLACALAGLGSDRRFVYRQISDPVYWTPTWAKRWRTAATYRRASHVVALSHQTAEIVSLRFRVPRDKISVIPNGVDIHRFAPPSLIDRQRARQRFGIDDSAFVVAQVGVLTNEKGVLDLARAVPEGSTLLLAGDGPRRADVEATVASAGASSRLVGVVPDIESIYAAADVVALASWSEQHPAALIEAGLCGRPVVCTRVGAVSEIVADRETGLMVEPSDVDALRTAIKTLRDDRQLRDRYGCAARAHCVERFSIEEVAGEWARTLMREGTA